MAESSDARHLSPPESIGPGTYNLSGSGAGPAGSSQAVPEKIGRYRALKLLGRGGMGTVYLARDDELGRLVALKVPHFTTGEGSTVPERFYREARAIAGLDHPNVCPIYDVGQFEGAPYLTMAYL